MHTLKFHRSGTEPFALNRRIWLAKRMSCIQAKESTFELTNKERTSIGPISSLPNCKEQLFFVISVCLTGTFSKTFLTELQLDRTLCIPSANVQWGIKKKSLFEDSWWYAKQFIQSHSKLFAKIYKYHSGNHPTTITQKFDHQPCPNAIISWKFVCACACKHNCEREHVHPFTLKVSAPLLCDAID